MLNRLISILPLGNQKYPLVYQRMIDAINVRLDIQKNKFLLGHPTQTLGVELLRFIMLNIDLEEILSYESDIDKLTNIIDYVEGTYRGAFDPVHKGRIEKGLFTSREGSSLIPEFIMNVEPANKIIDYPFDQPFEAWNGLRATRIIHHDSNELIDDLHTWWLKFRKLPSSYMLISVDVRTLIFKWVKYVEYCRSRDIEPKDLEFLRNSELVHWHDDLFDIWILNMLNSILSPTMNDLPKDAVQYHIEPYIAREQLVNDGLNDMIRFVQASAQGTIRLQDMLVTKWINNKSIFDMIAIQERFVMLPELRQYRWLDIIRWMPYLRLILNLNKYYPQVGVTKMISERAKDIMNRDLKFQNLENSLVSPLAKRKLAAVLAELNALVNMYAGTGRVSTD